MAQIPIIMTFIAPFASAIWVVTAWIGLYRE